MHRSAQQFHSCCQPRLRCYFYNIHVRRLSSPGTASVVNSDKQAIETSEPWPDRSGKALARREEDIKNIIVDDLSATLEAHRASNRAALIRKVKPPPTDPAGPIIRPLLVKVGDGGSEVKKTHERKVDEPYQMWPADSVQAKEKYGKKFVNKNDPLEYTGVAQWPKKPWDFSHSSEDMPMQRPWLAYLETTSGDYLKRLTNEIKAYEAYMRLSPQEEAASQLVISDVKSVARHRSETQPLTLLGSRSTGMATPISDFDFTFAQPNSLPEDWIPSPGQAGVSQARSNDYDYKLKTVKALRTMDGYFRSSNKFKDTDLIRHARVPIIRSKHVATGLAVQIQTMVPYQAAQDYSIACMSEFPALRPLYIILRYCLEVRDLTTVFEGGLGSYSILMMIVTALKHCGGKFASDDLAGQLLHVLEFYGKADLYKVGFSANPPQVFLKQKARWSLKERMVRATDPQLSGIDMMQKFNKRKPYLLCLQDPANNVNDLGKNAYAIKHIQATFNKARESIQTGLEKWNEKSDDKAKGGTWSCLESLVRADYGPFEVRRNKVERCAYPRQLNDGDYSKERIMEEFEKRAKWYKYVAEEDDNLPKSALEAIDGNAVESIEAEDGLSGGTKPARYRVGLLRSQENNNKVRTQRRQAREKAIAAEEQTKLQRLHGTNDDEYGWQSSSPTDKTTLLQAIAAPKSALAAKISASEYVPHAQTQNQDGDTQTTEPPAPDMSATTVQRPDSDAAAQTKAQEWTTSYTPTAAAKTAADIVQILQGKRKAKAPLVRKHMSENKGVIRMLKGPKREFRILKHLSSL